MSIKISKANSFSEKDSFILLSNQQTNFSNYNFSLEEKDYINKNIENKETSICINKLEQRFFIIYSEKNKKTNKQKEAARKTAHKIYSKLQEFKYNEITIIDELGEAKETLAFVEGLALSSYKFTKYFTKEKEKKENKLQEIKLISNTVSEKDLFELSNLVEGVFLARTLVNEPLSYLTAEKLADELKQASKAGNFSLEVFDKSKIKSLKMGGLLAVNKGSTNPPTFSVLEWKPENAKNSKPIILVGKGVVYDTGGLSIKPTANSMDFMKSDMGGAAAVAGAIYSIAKSELPIHVIGLIPATENSVSAEAYVPGDVVKMHNQMTVEVLNTDAEGRMILADALSYAQKYKPELVLDIATLTGSAANAIGKEASVVMGTASDESFEKLEKSGWNTYERTIRFPFWDEYGEYIKSSIADIKNLGGPEAGAITAGKFLQHFTDYKWIHIDIAGSAFTHKEENYRGTGGTGIGVRLFFDFIKNY